MAPYSFLSALRLTALIQALQDVRTLPQNLLALRRTPIVNAIEGEIMARFTGYLQIADLVADDSQAVTYTAGKFSMESTSVPNLKLGINMSQGMLNHLQGIIGRNGDIRDDVGWLNWENRTIDALLLGVRWRMEALIVGMWLDGFSYDRLGIKMTNVTWGMPSDLKVTAAVGWAATPGSATPVADIWAMRLLAQRRYGQTFNRLTMSTPAFQAMIATTEFQNKARTFLAPNVSYVNLTLSDLGAQQAIATNVLGMQIELYDAQYYSQAPNGSYSTAPFLPVNKVVFSNTADDNNAGVMDFANAVVTESLVAGLVGGFNDLGGPQYGPISYATVPADLNPPSITYWGVGRGFPRKHMLQSTAVLDIGTVTDAIPTTAPF